MIVGAFEDGVSDVYGFDAGPHPVPWSAIPAASLRAVPWWLPVGRTLPNCSSIERFCASDSPRDWPVLCWLGGLRRALAGVLRWTALRLLGRTAGRCRILALGLLARLVTALRAAAARRLAAAALRAAAAALRLAAAA
ncbi:hypothetical protein AB0J43_35820, partial [Nonomuraea fuscirosea]